MPTGRGAGRGGRGRATSETGSQLLGSMVQGSAADLEALEAQVVGKRKVDDRDDWSEDLPLSALRKVPKRLGTPSKESKKDLDPVPERSSAQSKEPEKLLDIVKREGSVRRERPARQTVV